MWVTRVLLATLWIVIVLSFSSNVNNNPLSSRGTNWNGRAAKSRRPNSPSTLERPRGRGAMPSIGLDRFSIIKGKPKPLTAKQLRAREKLLPPPKPYVFREHKFKDRIPLANFTVGQQLTGKIIAIAE